ncbi:MAG TPA: UTRA domain-containing protein [Actinomycetota bacterium]|nr:UTRA domain-containing protein [Actinomycetota bacterium]
MEPSNEPPRPLVRRAIPTDPAVRSSESLFLTESAGQAGRPSRKLLSSGLAPAPAAVAERMGVAPGDDLLTRRRLMLVDDVPVRVAVSYFHPVTPEAPELSGGTFLERGLQALYERHGRRFGRAEETLVARPPAPEEVQLLELEEGEPVVEILRTSYDEQDTPVHTLQTICAASRHVFQVRQPPDDSIF